MTSLVAEQPTLALDLIHVHPHNVRRNAVADEELVDSIRSTGIAQALTVMPYAGTCPEHDECFTLGAGHRRFDGAAKAGLTEVPVMLRDDLVTESLQIEFMLVENLHRQDLTAVEEAEAYEQLVLQGMDVAAIAKATGRNASTVKARLKLNDLAESSRERLHAGEVTLLDADAMLEFADDPEITAKLEEAIGTSNFRWSIEDARRGRERKARRAEQIAELEETGAKEVEELRDGTQKAVRYLPESLRDPAEHDGCLAYVVPTSQWQEPYLVCTDATRHPVPEEAVVEPVESEWEKKRAAREAEQARYAAAAAVRLQWLREHFAGMFPTKTHQPLAAAAQAFLPLLILDGREAIDTRTLMGALGISFDPLDPGHYVKLAEAQSAAAAGLLAAKPTKVLQSFSEYIAALVADQVATDSQWLDDPDVIRHHLVLWDWLRTAGYPMSDVDVEIRTRLETKLAEISEAEAS